MSPGNELMENSIQYEAITDSGSPAAATTDRIKENVAAVWCSHLLSGPFSRWHASKAAFPVEI